MSARSMPRDEIGALLETSTVHIILSGVDAPWIAAWMPVGEHEPRFQTTGETALAAVVRLAALLGQELAP